MEEMPLFRASKKRKFTRSKHLAEDDDDHAENQNPSTQSAPEPPDDAVEDEVKVSSILKLRKQNKARGGVQFSNIRSRDGYQAEEASSAALVPTETEDDTLQDVSSRFTKSTGPVVDIDRHMMAYIDSEMAKRRTSITKHPTTSTNTNINDSDEYDAISSESELENKPIGTTNTRPSPSTKTPYSTQTPLSEFDLGPQAHDLNFLRTSAAISQAQSGLPPPSEIPDRKPRRQRKPRLGRDGKPLRPRPRKTRDTADLARDALVEQVMAENRIDSVYELSSASRSAAGAPHGRSATTNANMDMNADADEQLAERFRQEFMDAMAERQQRHSNMAKAKASKGQEAVIGGPKLGGSRAARAKMQASLQQQQQTGSEKK